ncbi:SusC/RagA family TonB-linked outer membrane protein [Chitinophaga defluvii]|uniref:SusC/RagA family TonB-linked outer membrane protein n=1 Tax=Chitinophaga defluvii TaxID=3163343 RepID=A0ABV2T1L5_9BACT
MLQFIFSRRLIWRKRPSRHAMLFFFATALLFSMKGLAQTITLSGRQLSLQQAFDEIKKQTNYVVLFNPLLVDANTTVSLNVKKQPLEAFMQTIIGKSTKQALSFTIVGTNIVIFPKARSTQPESGDNAVPVEPLTIDISGIVYDSKTGIAIPGATVMAIHSGKGTQTDEKGMFTLKKINDKEQVSISSIGYVKTTIPATSIGANGFIKLEVATSELDQAIVRAYGITSKRLSTGNITRISGAEIARQPVMNPLLALQGRVPGMLVTPTSGHASSPVKVEIRGRNSLSANYNSEPLYIIDGVPINVLSVGAFRFNNGVSTGYAQGGISLIGGQSPLFNLNSNDIASIEVLKDAGATAIYGSRGANGVILITTKKGEPGRTKLQVTIDQGIVSVSRPKPFLNTQEYLKIRREAFKNDGITPTIDNAPDLMRWDTTRYTDWQREVTGTGSQTRIGLSLSGGNALSYYSISGGYDRQVDALNRSGANQRATLSSNYTLRSLNQKLKVSFGTDFSHTFVDAINDFRGAGKLAPNAPPIFDNKGNLNYADWNVVNKGSDFMFAYLLMPNVSKGNQFGSRLSVSYELLKGLTLSTSGGLTYTLFSSDYFVPIAAQNPLRNPTGRATFGSTKNSNWIIEPKALYSRVINRASLSLQVGGTLQSTKTVGTTISAAGYDNDNLLHSINSAPFKQIQERDGQYKYVGAFAILDINWADKYLLQISARRDGSSRFAPGTQFGNFGSVSGAWILSEEKWMKPVLPAWISLLKLRSSYGIGGGDNAISDYEYMAQWANTAPGEFEPLYPYGGVQPFMPINPVNQRYQWESNKKFEAALELSFLNDKISAQASYYLNRSGDQVTKLPTPKYTGFESVTANWMALVQNTGVNIELNAQLVNKTDFSWSLGFNISVQRNKLVSYPGFELSPYVSEYKIGQSLSTKYLLHYLGIDPLTGFPGFEDLNKDGRISTSSSGAPGTLEDDRYIALETNPAYFGGIVSSFRYKDLFLNLGFDYIKQYGANPYVLGYPGRMENIPVSALRDYWRKPGDNARYPRLSTVGDAVGNMVQSDAYYTDASFLRLNSFSISYSLPKKIIKRARLSEARINFRTNNIFTITNYIGRDPQLQDLSALPSPKTYATGLSLTF